MHIAYNPVHVNFFIPMGHWWDKFKKEIAKIGKKGQHGVVEINNIKT